MNAEQKEWTEDEIEEMLNEMYGTFKIGCCEFDAGRILRELDPVAFRCCQADMPEIWICGECGEAYDTMIMAEECCAE